MPKSYENKRQPGTGSDNDTMSDDEDYDERWVEYALLLVALSVAVLVTVPSCCSM